MGRNSKSMRILTVGFSDEYIKKLEMELEKYFICVIDIAKNMHDAIQYIDFRDYELVIIDKLSTRKQYIHFAPILSVEFTLKSYVKKLKNKHTKIIILASNHNDIITFFSWGVDDVITQYQKHPDLVAARVLATIRHYFAKQIKINKLLIDIQNRKIVYDEENISLTTKAFDILVYLGLRQSKVFSINEIKNAIWKEPEYVSDDEVQKVIIEVRRKICVQQGFLIIHHHNIGKKGYKFSLLSSPIEVQKIIL